MSQNRFPENRKIVREARMSAMSIVSETAMMAERLQAMEHRGLGDTREAARAIGSRAGPAFRKAT